MTALVSITQEAVFTALRTFILSLIDCEVIQGLGNRVSTPTGSFIAMTAINQKRLSTNISVYTDPGVNPGTRGAMQPSQITIQVDCYGAESQDWAIILTTMLRDPYGCDSMAPTVQPLYADDPIQLALTDAEAEYEQRWLITAVLQYNPVVTLPQQFADVFEIELVPLQ